ncbi:MAG: D-alanine--D-alanine ligase [Planctomycetota bacterium]|jgi:D-alanine-D-alanine ligase|nr:D-alanine--D-alanine ligase [Planctomycetota bacterium]
MTGEETKLHGLKTAVVCGGPGAEREVSLASGECVYAALSGAGFRVEKAVVPPEAPDRYLRDLECDIAVMMLHGEFGEDGQAQRILEERGVSFSGSASGVCSLAMDKNACKILFAASGIPTAGWLRADSVDGALKAIADAELTPPLVVKPNSLGSSVGVTIIREGNQLSDALALALSMDKSVIVEEFVDGRELTAGWLDGGILPVVELIPDGGFYDYQAKYVSDKTRYLCPAELTGDMEEEISRIIRKTVEIIPVRDLARVDILLGEDGPKVLEINLLPGFTSHSLLPMAARAIGMDMPDLCARLAQMAARRGGLL